MSGIAYEYDVSAPTASHGYLFGAVKRLLADLPARSTVLDLSCGSGAFLSGEFSEVDFFLANPGTPADVILSSSGPVDAIISTEVIEHVYFPQDLFRTAYAVLKPGGSLVMTTAYRSYLKNLTLALLGKTDSESSSATDQGHMKFWSRRALTQMANEAGFEVIKTKGAGGLPYVWKSMAMLMRKPLN